MSKIVPEDALALLLLAPPKLAAAWLTAFGKLDKFPVVMVRIPGKLACAGGL